MPGTGPAKFDEPSNPAPGRKWRDLFELAGGYALILSVIWTSRPLQSWLYWSAIVWVLVATCVSFDGLRAMGLGSRGLKQSLWIAAVASLIALATIAVASRFLSLHAPHGPGMWIRTFTGYAVWSFIQQLLLQAFFLRRLLRLLPSRRAAAITAASIFAIAHLPNPILTPMTLIWGLCACFLFLRYGNIYPLALAHAALGITVAVTTPPSLIHHMRVGRGYILYHAPPGNQRSHSDQTVSTHVCVITAAPTRRS